MDKYVVVLAAGKGTGMNSRDPEHSKVSYPILGKPIINYVIDAVKPLDPKQIVTVVGFGGELTKKLVEKESDVVWQKRLLGTGHAVLQAKPFLEGKPGQTLVIYGDTPLVETETLRQIFHIHEKNRYDMTVVSAILDNPKGYGRILREDKSNRILAIREESDCTFSEYEINEVNTGICIIDNELLFKYIERLSVDNNRHLFYLSELVLSCSPALIVRLRSLTSRVSINSARLVGLCFAHTSKVFTSRAPIGSSPCTHTSPFARSHSKVLPKTKLPLNLAIVR